MTRISETAFAIITRAGESGLTEYLLQWNENGNAYSLIGGDVKDGESFSQACWRGIVEAVECVAADVVVAPNSYTTLRFAEYSWAAKANTDYHWQLFIARLADTVTDRLPANCQWTTADHIRAGSTADGQPIAEQAKRVLKAINDAEFDLFVSYGQDDNLDGSVTRLVEHVLREHSTDKKIVEDIVNRLGCHALAVEIVAVYLGNNRSIGLQDYLNGLIRKGTSLKLGQAGDDAKVRARLSQSIETNIAELLEPTFAKLEAEQPLAMRALEWAARMPPDHVPWIWLRELLAEEFADQLQHDADDPDPWQDIIQPQLSGGQLLTGAITQPTARMHRIVQSIVAARRHTNSATDNGPPVHTAPVESLLRYCKQRSKVMEKSWGQPGVNWELTPLFEQATLLLTQEGVGVSSLIYRLINPLRLDGRLLPAVELLKQVINLEESRLASAPDNEDYAYDLSVSYNHMGDLFWALGNETDSREFYEKALEARELLVANSPENAEYARGLSASYNRLGDVLRALGNSTEACNLYEKALKVREQLAANASENTDYAHDLWVSYNKMGDVFRALGNGTQSREFHQKALEVSERLVASRPECAGYSRDLWVSCWWMASISEDERQPEFAAMWWRRAHGIPQGMLDRGLNVSPDDMKIFAQFKEKLGGDS